VASPRPIRIVEEAAVQALIAEGFVVITVGGGGIPVVKGADGHLHGVAAVIDKDFASSLLATRIGAQVFVISTAVDRVALNWGQPNQEWLDHMTADQARGWLAEGGHFMAGSMAPKIEACLQFLDGGGQQAIITRPEQLEKALKGHAGTRIEP
jgi:carbamate kinase